MVAEVYTTTFESQTITATSSGASATVVYTVPANHDSTIDYFGVANGGGSTQTVTIEVFHADDSTYKKLTNAHNITANTTYHLIDADRLHLHAGDKIVASKNGGTIDISISAREFFNPNR